MTKHSDFEGMLARARAIISGECAINSNRANVAAMIVARLLLGETLTPDEIREYSEDAGRIVEHLRNRLGVPVITHRPRSKYASYSMAPQHIEQFLDAEQRPKQRRLCLALAANRRLIKLCRSASSAIAENDWAPHEKIEEIARQSMPHLHSYEEKKGFEHE